jgi:DNA-binding transcriptional MocR family regulator
MLWQFSPAIDRLRANEIRELLKLIEQPDIISFAGGIPSSEHFPVAVMSEVMIDLMSDDTLARSSFQYSASEGYPPLRAWIVEWLRRGGVARSLDEVLITSGSQQALDLLGRCFLGPDDPVAVPRPCYLGALQVFGTHTSQLIDLKSDAEGPCPDALTAAFRDGARLLYLNPDFANPSGETISLPRRRALIEVVALQGGLIIEDTPYRELRYDGDAVPTMAALEQERSNSGANQSSCVVQLGSFSKTLAPGMRVGWVSGHAQIIAKLVLLKQAADLHTPTFNQIVMHRLAQRVFDAQVTTMCGVYHERRDAMLAALELASSRHVSWSLPSGGMFLWLKFANEIDTRHLLERSIREIRVAFVPGSAFYPRDAPTNFARLSFSSVSPDQIHEGIRRLMALTSSSMPR